MDAGQHSPTKW